jgi:hypothetical protein
MQHSPAQVSCVATSKIRFSPLIERPPPCLATRRSQQHPWGSVRSKATAVLGAGEHIPLLATANAGDVAVHKAFLAFLFPDRGPDQQSCPGRPNRGLLVL